MHWDAENDFEFENGGAARALHFRQVALKILLENQLKIGRQLIFVFSAWCPPTGASAFVKTAAGRRP